MPGATHAEARRLAALQALDVLDTPSEPRFDRLVRLAARVLDAPIALVSLVDADRQWFKSCVGVDFQETPRALSFCAHALDGVGPLVVQDAADDPRFAGNPMVTGPPGIRFYAGHPFRAAGGESLGTLCVLDTAPRTPSAEDLEALRDLAGLVELEINAGDLSRALAARRLSESRLKAVLDATAEGIIGADSERRVTFMSAGAARLLRRDPATALGRPAEAVLGSLAGTAGEARIARGDGESLDVEYRWSPAPAGAPEPGEVLVFRDITERRRLEALRERFLRSAAHELRTPITSVRGYAEELLDAGPGELGGEQRDAADAILRSAARLEALVEDLLLVLRLESGAVLLAPEPLSLGALVSEAAARLGRAAEAAGVELRLDLDQVTLSADGRLLERTVTGLLRTAVAVSPAGSVVDVAVRARGDAAVLSVTDAGGAPAADELHRVEEPFHRATARPQSGDTGFSATIAHGVAALHGGRCELTVGPRGDGTAVSVTLPLPVSSRAA